MLCFAWNGKQTCSLSLLHSGNSIPDIFSLGKEGWRVLAGLRSCKSIKLHQSMPCTSSANRELPWDVPAQLAMTKRKAAIHLRPPSWEHQLLHSGSHRFSACSKRKSPNLQTAQNRQNPHICKATSANWFMHVPNKCRSLETHLHLLRTPWAWPPWLKDV